MITYRLARVICVVLSLAGCQTAGQRHTATCQPLGYDEAALRALKTEEFGIADAERRQQFALALVPCLASANPQLRDGIAYAGLAQLLRGRQLTPDTVQRLRVVLLQSIDSEAQDTAGVRRPFAALALSEVARADRMDPVFTAAQRAELVASAIRYMTSISDYRGYHETEGWRHAVAHTADLLLQLVLNPELTTRELENIATAIAAQVAPPGEHFYVYGEYERLARPIFYLASRGEISEAFWTQWFAALASPAPFMSWGDVWSSQAGLAKMHNTKTFAETLYVFATAGKVAGLEPLAEGSLALLAALN